MIVMVDLDQEGLILGACIEYGCYTVGCGC